MKILTPFLLCLVLGFTAVAQVKKPASKPDTGAKPTQKVTLELANGDSMTGWFVGGDTKSITLQVSNNKVNVNLDEISVLRIGEPKEQISASSKKVVTETKSSKSKTLEDLRLIAASSAIPIKVDYDEFKDSTFVAVNPISVSSDRIASLRMTVAFQFTGKVLSASPTFLGITFYSTSKEWQFLNYNDLTILADGERISLGKAIPSRDVALGYVSETLIYTTSVADLEKMAKAAEIRFQIGSAEGRFESGHLTGLKTIYEMVNLK